MASVTRQYEYWQQTRLRYERQLERQRAEGAPPHAIEMTEGGLRSLQKKIAEAERDHPRAVKAAGRGRGGHQYGGNVRNVNCAACGKPTHRGIEGYSDAEMCRPCLAESLYENQHSDDGHTGAMKDCPVCGPQYRTMARLRNAKESN
jgi:hypothetical protein